jgi:predicted Zn-dependent protease with MMP-like domain
MKLSEREFADLVREALRDIPEPFARCLEEIVVDVEPMPDAEALREGGVDDPSELLGIYTGTPLTERSVDDALRLPDRIILYQRNIERECRTKRDVVEEIRTTVLHEVGHHFGLDEDDLFDVGYD